MSSSYLEKKQAVHKEVEPSGIMSESDNMGHYTNESIRKNKNIILRSRLNKTKRTNIHLSENSSRFESIDKEEKDYKNDQKDCQYLDYVKGIGNTIYLKPGFVTDIMLPEG